MIERTLSIVKPDAAARDLVGEVLRRYEAAGLRIVALKRVSMTKVQAEGFYAVHRERPFFESLTTFMSSGASVVFVVEGEGAIGRVREIMGATDPAKAAGGTIRRDHGTSIERNAVHGSDAPDTASFEIGYFFSTLEILPA